MCVNDHVLSLATGGTLWLPKTGTLQITDHIYLDLKLTKGEISVQRIKNIYLGKGPHDYTIIGVINQAIENYEKELAPGSLKNYYTTKSYIEAYCKKKYKEGDVRLKFRTYSFIDQLKSYILHHPLKTHDPCANNGCMKHLERLKKIITCAFEMRYIDRDVFASFKIKKISYEAGRKLSWDQFKTLENHSVQGILEDPCKICSINLKFLTIISMSTLTPFL